MRTLSNLKIILLNNFWFEKANNKQIQRIKENLLHSLNIHFFSIQTEKIAPPPKHRVVLILDVNTVLQTIDSIF